jgi:glycosyltransferase involved in cell wall biosynthesis
MPAFSLVVATKGRTNELERLLESLIAQTCTNFELIVVDQNGDGRLDSLLVKYANEIQIRHLRCDAGVSQARNLGIEAADGEFLAFPDDDCWYQPDTIANVLYWFQQNPDYGILSVTVRDEYGVRSANKWNAESCDLAPVNIFRTTAAYTFFVRRSALRKQIYFDETLGPASGTIFVSAEDTDFVLCAMQQGVRGRFVSKWYVGHPRRDMFSGSISRDRAYGYGLGMGKVLSKHSMTLLGLALFSFDVLRTVRAFCTGKFEGGSLCWMHGRGILTGYIAREHN